jgi:hypothetical protein
MWLIMLPHWTMWDEQWFTRGYGFFLAAFGDLSLLGALHVSRRCWHLTHQGQDHPQKAGVVWKISLRCLVFPSPSFSVNDRNLVNPGGSTQPYGSGGHYRDRHRNTSVFVTASRIPRRPPHPEAIND